MSKNIERHRNIALALFLSVFYITLGFSILKEQPNQTLSEEILPLSASENHTVLETAETKAAVSFPVDINLANEEELAKLTGIGPVLAKRIVLYRKTRPFANREEIMGVYGIGPEIYEKIAGDICVSVETTTTAYSNPPVIVQVIPSEPMQTESSTPPLAVSERPVTKEPVSVVTTTKPAYSKPPDEIKTAFHTTVKTVSTAAVTKPLVPINLNTANLEEFASLPGVDEEMAEKMVYCRFLIGGSFTSVYEILYTEGMTFELFNRIRPYIYVR